MKDFSLISNYMLKGSHTKENPSKNERNPGMKEFSLISNEIVEGIHTKENPSKNGNSRNEGILFNFQLHVKRKSYKGKSIQK